MWSVNKGRHVLIVPPSRPRRAITWTSAEIASWGPRLLVLWSFPFTKLVGSTASVFLVLTLVGLLTPTHETSFRAERPMPGEIGPPLIDTLPADGIPSQLRTRSGAVASLVEPVVDVAWERPTIEQTQALAPVKPLKTERHDNPAPKTIYTWKVPARHDLPRPGQPCHQPVAGAPHHGGVIEQLLREARERAEHHSDGGKHRRHDESDSGSEGRGSGSVARHADRHEVRSSHRSLGD